MMGIVRYLLILGVLSHPFCLHCFAEMQTIAKRYDGRCTSQSWQTPNLESSVGGESLTVANCTKVPLRAESEFHCDVLFSSVICEIFLVSPAKSALWLESSVRCHFEFPPLYLSLGVLLI
jgi:hypothetical protein